MSSKGKISYSLGHIFPYYDRVRSVRHSGAIWEISKLCLASAKTVRAEAYSQKLKLPKRDAIYEVNISKWASLSIRLVRFLASFLQLFSMCVFVDNCVHQRFSCFLGNRNKLFLLTHHKNASFDDGDSTLA